jgi:segregation and condensation protein B
MEMAEHPEADATTAADRLWALLFVHGDPLPEDKACEWLGVEGEELAAVVQALQAALARTPFTLRRVAGGIELVTRPAFTAFLDRVAGRRGPEPLSHAAWECLAVIAWRQPVTRLEIEQARQVNSDRAIETLLSRGLIQEVGRKETPGRPILYGTTAEFLRQFGLNSLEDLPPGPDALADATRPAGAAEPNPA